MPHKRKPARTPSKGCRGTGRVSRDIGLLATWCKGSQADHANEDGLSRFCHVVTKKAIRSIATQKPDLDLIAAWSTAAEAHAK